MDKFMVVIKGSMETATRAASMRGLIVEDEAKPCDGWTVINVYGSWEQVSRWFCEAPIEPPYPEGNCLWYKELK